MPTILYVDDEPELLEIGKLFLEKNSGFSVTTLTSAQEALVYLKGHPVDAIIADYQMPEMDGIEFLKTVRARGDKTPFIIFTGKGREEIAIEALNSGADFYLQKGGEPRSQFTELAFKIRHAISRTQAEIALVKNQIQLANAMSLASLVSWEFDVASASFTFNDQFYALYGTTAEREGGLTMPAETYTREFVHPDDARRVAKIIKEALSVSYPDYSVQAEHRIIRRDGQVRDIIVRFAVILDDKGKVVKTYGANQDITEHKRSEAALRESEERYRTLFDNMLEGFAYCRMIYDGKKRPVDFVYLNVNRSFDRIIGTKGMTGKRATEVFPGIKEAFPEIFEVYGRVARGGSPESFDLNFTPIGKWLSISVYAPAPDYFVAVFEDITEKKESESALRESEQKYRNVFDRANDAILLHFLSTETVPGKFIEVNEAATKMLGYTRAELLALGPSAIVPEELHHILKDLIREAERKDNFRFEIRLHRKDGTTFPAESRGQLITFAGKRTWLSFIRDVTDRKKAEEALVESEERCRTLMANLPEIVYRIHLREKSRMQFFNDQVLALTGYSEEELVRGETCSIDPYIHPDDHATVVAAVNHAVAERGIFSVEYRFIHKNGSIRYFNEHGRVIEGPDKEPLYIDGMIRDVTDRKKIEKALKENEEWFKTIFHNQQTGLLMIDPAMHTIVDANRTALDLIGAPKEDVIGKSCHTFVCPAENGRCPVTDLHQKVDNSERVLINAEGGRIPIIKSVSQIKIGGRSFLIESFIDITDRRQAEEKLMESENRYRSLFDHMIEGHALHEIVTDKKGNATEYRILDVNPAYEKLLGISRENAIGKLSREVYGASEPPYLEYYAEVAAKREGKTFETYYPPMKKHFTISVYSPNEGQFATVFEDIAKRKRTEDALQQSEEQYRTLLNQVPELVLVHQNGIIRYTNPAAVHTVGFRPEEVLGRPVTDFIPKEYHERVAGIIRRRMTGENADPYEIEILTKMGGRRTVFVSGCRIEYEGSPASLAVLTDITERKALEKSLQEANRKLNLLASITRHDILNQLLVLQGYIELTREHRVDEKTLLGYLEKEEQAAKRIEHQIRFTKEYQEMGVKVPVWRNVRESVEKATEELPVRDIRIGNDLSDVEVYADPLFDKVFYNLIDNSLRYGGEKMTTIRVAAHESGAGLTIVCEDDGAGISAKDKAHIFEKGFGKHTGLGLFLVREILSITGITIAETSAHGKGARFEILVPKGMYRFPAK